MLKLKTNQRKILEITINFLKIAFKILNIAVKILKMASYMVE